MMLNDDFADLQPGQPQTDEQKIAVLLDLLALVASRMTPISMLFGTQRCTICFSSRSFPNEPLRSCERSSQTRTTAILFSTGRWQRVKCWLTWGHRPSPHLRR